MSSNKEIKLMPCRNCSFINTKLVFTALDGWFVYCPWCGTRTLNSPCKDEAIECWNLEIIEKE